MVASFPAEQQCCVFSTFKNLPMITSFSSIPKPKEQSVLVELMYIGEWNRALFPKKTMRIQCVAAGETKGRKQFSEITLVEEECGEHAQIVERIVSFFPISVRCPACLAVV